VTGAAAAERAWPPGGRQPETVAADAYGYTGDAAVADVLTGVLADPPDLTVAQLNGPDTAAHVHGPDSDAAIAAYRETDAQLGRLREALAPVWDELVWIVVSDHDQEQVLPAEPIDLVAAAAEAGLALQVAHEGNAAVLAGPDLARRHLLAAVDGVEGVGLLPGRDGAGPDGVGLAWARPGRHFAAGGRPLLAGAHGGPRNRAQVAVVAGGHPAVAAIAAGLAAAGVQAADWAPTVAALLELRLPDAGGRSLLGA
jgi:hypothetical protein